MPGHDWCLVIFNSRRRISIEFIWHLLAAAASDVTITKQTNKQKSSDIDNIPKLLISLSDLVVICCEEVWSIYLAVRQMSEYHVWSELKATLAKHSPQPTSNAIEPKSFHSESKSLIGHTLSHPWLAFCGSLQSSQAVKTPFYKRIPKYSIPWGTQSRDSQKDVIWDLSAL